MKLLNLLLPRARFQGLLFYFNGKKTPENFGSDLFTKFKCEKYLAMLFMGCCFYALKVIELYLSNGTVYYSPHPGLHIYLINCFLNRLTCVIKDGCFYFEVCG